MPSEATMTALEALAVKAMDAMQNHPLLAPRMLFIDWSNPEHRETVRLFCLELVANQGDQIAATMPPFEARVAHDMAATLRDRMDARYGEAVCAELRRMMLEAGG